MYKIQTLNKISKKYILRYSLYDVVFFLVYSLIINPNSKSGMYKEASKKSIIKPSFFKDYIYRAMDILEENKSEILKACYHNLPTNINRDTIILYYNCTNTYFESELEHDLRAKGKKNEKEALVSFGLVMDRSGISLTLFVS